MSFSFEQPAILIITHVIPFPPAAGNEIRILNLSRWLQKKGFKVVLLLNAAGLSPVTRQTLNEIYDGVFLLGGSAKRRFWERILPKKFFGHASPSPSPKQAMATEGLIRMTEKLCKKHHPVAVFAEYIFTAPCLDVVPPAALKIIDTHDMFSRKKEQVLAFGIEDPFHCTPEEERGYLLKGDLVVAIQAKEARMFRGLVPEKQVITVGIDFEVVPQIDNTAVAGDIVLVVGSDNPLNIHGLNEFISHVWPVVQQGCPGAVLRVAGKLGNHLREENVSVEKVGWITDLHEEYRKASIVINPTVAGTGLKIKTVEALCRAKAFVGSPNSVEGLFYKVDAPFVVAKNWADFSVKILHLLGDEAARRELQERAWRYARENFHPDKVYAPLAEALEVHLRNSSSEVLMDSQNVHRTT